MHKIDNVMTYREKYENICQFKVNKTLAQLFFTSVRAIGTIKEIHTLPTLTLFHTQHVCMCACVYMKICAFTHAHQMSDAIYLIQS